MATSTLRQKTTPPKSKSALKMTSKPSVPREMNDKPPPSNQALPHQPNSLPPCPLSPLLLLPPLLLPIYHHNLTTNTQPLTPS